MNYYLLPPLLSTVAYACLMMLVLRSPRMRNLFAVYLLVSSMYGFGTLMVFSGYLPGLTRLWFILFNLGALSAFVSYYHFLCAFTHQRDRVAVKLGYAFTFLVSLPLVSLGVYPVSFQLLEDGELDINWGPYFYVLTAVCFAFLCMSATLLSRRLRELKDPLERNRVIYARRTGNLLRHLAKRRLTTTPQVLLLPGGPFLQCRQARTEPALPPRSHFRRRLQSE